MPIMPHPFPISLDSATRLFLFSLLLLLLQTRIYAQSAKPDNEEKAEKNLTQPYPIEPGTTWYKRIRVIAENSPTLDTLRTDRALQDDVAPLYDRFELLTRIIETRRKDNTPDACSLRSDSPWSHTGRSRMKHSQVGIVDETCLSLVEGTLAVKKGELKKPFITTALEDIRRARKAFFTASEQSQLKPILENLNWTKLYIQSGFTLEYRGQECKAEFAFAYRINGVWYLRHSLTNHPIDSHQRSGFRNYTKEFISRDLRSLKTINYDFNNRLVNASTTMVSWSGSAAPGSVDARYFDDEEQALATALRRNAVAIDLAEDSVTPSNIAILALPMVMSFVPVAFLADLDSLGMVVYGLLTDVFAAIPFFVKGIELVRSSTNTRTEVNAFHMGNWTVGQMEIVGAECSGESKFGNIGWFFIVVALVMMSTGIALEILAARIMTRRRSDIAAAGGKKDSLTGPFGAAMLEKTGQGYMGGEFERVENAYFRKMEKLGLAELPKGWRRWLPGTRLRLRNEQTAGFGSAEREFEAGYETESFDRDLTVGSGRTLPR